MFALATLVTSDRLQALKAELTQSLPYVKSSHRCEAVARGLGFSTYASALAAARNISAPTAMVNSNHFVAYLHDNGFEVSSKPLYNAVAKIALRHVAEQTPKLTIWGIGVGQPSRKPDGHWENSRDLELKFGQRRKELIGDYAVEPFLASLAFLARVKQTKTIRKGTNSYWLKHVVEKYVCTYPDGEKLGPIYIPNGTFIAAALHAGFRIKTHVDDLGWTDLNVTFDMSRPHLVDLDCEIRPGSAYPGRSW